jgi:hypothetical protein
VHNAVLNAKSAAQRARLVKHIESSGKESTCLTLACPERHSDEHMQPRREGVASAAGRYIARSGSERGRECAVRGARKQMPERRRDTENSPQCAADLTGKLRRCRPGGEIEIKASEGARTKRFP